MCFRFLAVSQSVLLQSLRGFDFRVLRGWFSLEEVSGIGYDFFEVLYSGGKEFKTFTISSNFGDLYIILFGIVLAFEIRVLFCNPTNIHLDI